MLTQPRFLAVVRVQRDPMRDVHNRFNSDECARTASGSFCILCERTA